MVHGKAGPKGLHFVQPKQPDLGGVEGPRRNFHQRRGAPARGIIAGLFRTGLRGNDRFHAGDQRSSGAGGIIRVGDNLRKKKT